MLPFTSVDLARGRGLLGIPLTTTLIVLIVSIVFEASEQYARSSVELRTSILNRRTLDNRVEYRRPLIYQLPSDGIASS